MYCWPLLFQLALLFMTGNYMAQIAYKRTSYMECVPGVFGHVTL